MHFTRKFPNSGAQVSITYQAFSYIVLDPEHGDITIVANDKKKRVDFLKDNHR